MLLPSARNLRADMTVPCVGRSYPAVMESIVKTGAIDDATDKTMKEVIGKYASEFSV